MHRHRSALLIQKDLARHCSMNEARIHTIKYFEASSDSSNIFVRRKKFPDIYDYIVMLNKKARGDHPFEIDIDYALIKTKGPRFVPGQLYTVEFTLRQNDCYATIVNLFQISEHDHIDDMYVK